MQKLLLVILACFVAAYFFPTAVGQAPSCTNNSTTNDLSTCELCLGSAGGKSGDCGWCQAATYGLCSTNTTCGYITGGVFQTNVSQCGTCYTNSSYKENVCQFGSQSTFINSTFSYCDLFNNPPPPNNTNSTTGNDTCTVSQKCADASYAYGCSVFCAACNATNGNYIMNFKVCTDVATNINTSCSDEIKSGCIDPLAATSYTNDTSICRALIKANAPSQGTATTAAATTATTAASTATTAATTATSAASTATTAASTATGAATTRTTSVSSATASTNNSGAASFSIFVSMALLLAALLF